LVRDRTKQREVWIGKKADSGNIYAIRDLNERSIPADTTIGFPCIDTRIPIIVGYIGVI
jgi:hypothetical protein